MIKPKDKLDESVPFTVTAYNDYGQRLGTLPLNRPYQFLDHQVLIQTFQLQNKIL